MALILAVQEMGEETLTRLDALGEDPVEVLMDSVKLSKGAWLILDRLGTPLAVFGIVTTADHPQGTAWFAGDVAPERVVDLMKALVTPREIPDGLDLVMAFTEAVDASGEDSLEAALAYARVRGFPARRS